jgi:hypothetical protein
LRLGCGGGVRRGLCGQAGELIGRRVCRRRGLWATAAGVVELAGAGECRAGAALVKRLGGRAGGLLEGIDGGKAGEGSAEAQGIFGGAGDFAEHCTDVRALQPAHDVGEVTVLLACQGGDAAAQVQEEIKKLAVFVRKRGEGLIECGGPVGRGIHASRVQRGRGNAR